MIARLAAVALTIAAASARANDVFVGAATPANERVSIDQIDHATLDGLLHRFVDDEGRVDYRGWHADAAARAELRAYLATLSAADPTASATHHSRLAYWINAYNAVTIEGILREYPTTSIRNHTAALWGYNIWKNLKLHVGGTAVSLDDIEHKRLRPMNEPRIHFAIVCASIGCPRLLNEAYTPERLDEQLDRNARHFFAQPQNFRVDPATGVVSLSSILKWFGEDFGPNEAAVLATISRWVPESARDLLIRPQDSVRYLEYNWALNEQ